METITLYSVLTICVLFILFKKYYIKKETKSEFPYELSIENTSNEPLTCVLFGINTYLLTPNFGSSIGIKISCNFDKSYLNVLRESSNNFFIDDFILTGKINDITQILTVTNMNAHGSLKQYPIITQEFLSDKNLKEDKEYGQTSIKVPIKLGKLGNKNISFTVLEYSKLTISMYPIKKEFYKTNLLNEIFNLSKIR